MGSYRWGIITTHTLHDAIVEHRVVEPHADTFFVRDTYFAHTVYNSDFKLLAIAPMMIRTGQVEAPQTERAELRWRRS